MLVLQVTPELLVVVTAVVVATVAMGLLMEYVRGGSHSTFVQMDAVAWLARTFRGVP